MGAMIGPITLTVGQPYKVSLAQDTAYIELQNDSLYDVWVYFGEAEPKDITNANNTWHRVVRRQHNGVIPVEGFRGASARERVNNAIGAFRGTVWLLAVNPGGLAVSGTISGRSQVYLTPYAQGDGLPAHSSLSTQTDLTSQPRIVAVPMDFSLGTNYTGHATFTAAGQSATAGILGLSNANVANNSVPIHLFGAVFSIANQPAATSGIDLHLQFCVFFADGVTLRFTYDILQVYLYAPAFNATPSSQIFVFAPPVPLGIQAQFGAATDIIKPRLYCNAISGTTVDLNYNVYWSTDNSNQSLVGSYGEASLFVTSPSSPAIY